MPNRYLNESKASSNLDAAAGSLDVDRTRTTTATRVVMIQLYKSSFSVEALGRLDIRSSRDGRDIDLGEAGAPDIGWDLHGRF